MATPPPTSTGQRALHPEPPFRRSESLPRDICVGVTYIMRTPEPKPIPTATQVVRSPSTVPALSFNDVYRPFLDNPLIEESAKNEKVSAKHR